VTLVVISDRLLRRIQRRWQYCVTHSTSWEKGLPDPPARGAAAGNETAAPIYRAGVLSCHPRPRVVGDHRPVRTDRLVRRPPFLTFRSAIKFTVSTRAIDDLDVTAATRAGVSSLEVFGAAAERL